jgi:glycosyltransferase involved in cell wall biosynthesis
MKYGRSAASTRQRLLLYEPLLREHGFELELQILLGDDHISALTSGKRSAPVKILREYLRRLRRLLGKAHYDAIWVHYEVFPYLGGSVDLLAKLHGKPLIYDFDDATFHTYDQHRSVLVRRVLGKRLAPLMRAADLCLCGNQYLQRYAQQYCSNSRILPTVVDTDMYVPKPIQNAVDRGLPVVGWIGSPTTWQFVPPLLSDILGIVRQHGTTFRVVGAGVAVKPSDGLTLIDWSEATEISDVQSMDIGIMPLPEEPWARGKCGYKLIQYGACGLPVIASPVGVNTEIVQAGRTGLLATTKEEWLNGLERLLKDANLRRSFGVAGRHHIVSHYSLQVHGPRLVKLLDQTITHQCAA